MITQWPNFIYVGLALALMGVSKSGSAQDSVDFNRDVLPVLSNHCFACHGPDESQRKADLRLDMEAEAKAEVIVPGDLDSELIRRITADEDDDRMPPPDSDKPLTEKEIQLLKTWIVQGANWETFWSLKPIRRPDLAAADNPWIQNPIDQFVSASLRHEGLEPTRRASKEKLIRRASFDLTGLPPTLDEIDAFLADSSPDAFAKVVDRYLASPHYGERMAMDWLDGARYADSNGFQNDFGRDMWPWRDWVINSFNDNMPFDEFTIEQLAGDMLPDATDAQRVATGFNRNNRSNTEGGSIASEWLVENIIDRVDTTSTVFLGLTMGCARCHDHKYDPITQREFYSFFDFFNSVDELGFYEETRGNVGPTVMLPTEKQKLQLADFDRRLQVVNDRLDHWDSEKEFENWKKATLVDLERDPPTEDVQPLFAANLDGSATIESSREPTQVEPDVAGKEPVWRSDLFGNNPFFNGQLPSHFEFGNTIQFSPEKAFSFSIWVKPGADRASGALISKIDDGNAYRGVDTLVLDDKRIKVHLIEHWPDKAVAVISNTKLQADTWSQVSVTYSGNKDADSVAIYINGEKSPQSIDQNAPPETLKTDQPFRIGSRSTSEPFFGSLARLRFYDRRNDDDEVRSLYRGELSQLLAREMNEENHQRLIHFSESFTKAPFNPERIAQERQEFEHEIASVMVMKERSEPRDTFVLRRGQYDQPDKNQKVTANTPAFLPPMASDAPKNRLGLAKWIASPDNPLTARVAVNRVWAKLFGQGIVSTTDNFGRQGSPPSDPELLDWLAAEFIESGWDLKQLHRTIMLSATYQQSSEIGYRKDARQLIARDPDNRLLARGPRFRLPAESIRDNALAAGGLLVSQLGGPSVKPYQPEGMWKELAGGAGQGPYVVDSGDNLYRRSLYTYRKRTVPHATLSTFDAPSFEICQVKRSRTNTPLQALAVLNDITYVEAARGLAAKMINLDADRSADKIAFAFRTATSRAPTEDELAVLQAGLDKYRAMYQADPESAKEAINHGESKPSPEMDEVNFAAYTAVASLILNLDETITKE